ncbi:MAG: S1-like domain-containing RNA-binding protein [Campylobacterales bacterium]|nr:S1-like domain-containing RNA-binding protein [Campylobacterales bacterium]
MNDFIEVGKINTLKVDRFTDPGAYLICTMGEDVLLPNQYITDDIDIEDEIDVFIYTDSEDRLVATTNKPKALLGDFEQFEVVGVEKFGAFVDWGLPKDLFVPRSLQKNPFKLGEKRILRVSLDKKRDMLIGDEKVGRFLSHKPTDLKKSDEVNALVLAKTPLGFKVILNNKYEGMIFTNEVYEDLKVGDRKKCFVKNIREDGKLDISLRAIGKNRDDETVEKIKTMLQKKGKLPYTYKIDPEVAKDVFQTSRKGFKRALTALIDEGVIELLEDGIVLKNIN